MVTRYLDLIVKLLPKARREWGVAMQAELAAIDSRSERRRFALGCTRAVLLHALRAPGRAVAVAGAVGLVLGSEIALAKAIGQTVPLVLGLALLFWLGRRPGFFGPVRRDRAARLVRAGGYAMIVLYLMTLIVGYGASGILRPDPKVPLFALLLTLYAGASLAMTARGSVFGGVGLAAGSSAGLAAGLASFIVMPFERSGPRLANGLPGHGIWLVAVTFGAPAAAAAVTARRTGRGDQAAMAAFCTGALAALLVAFLGVSAIALFPSRIPDLVGPVMIPGTSAAARRAADATEAADPYAGVLLFGGLLAAILWAMARPFELVAARAVLLTLLGAVPVWLCLSARHFPGATAIAVAAALMIVAAVIASKRTAPVGADVELGETALS
jgi:hypothetical protein